MSYECHLVSFNELPFILDCFFFHSSPDTFLISTILTSIPLSFVDCTLSVVSACIIQIFPHCSLEESLNPRGYLCIKHSLVYLASFAGVDAVVFARCTIVADGADATGQVVCVGYMLQALVVWALEDVDVFGVFVLYFDGGGVGHALDG